jgi:hypothetical protein
MTGELVTVPLAALVALAEYAESMKESADGEFLISKAERDASDREFGELIAALGVPGLLEEGSGEDPEVFCPICFVGSEPHEIHENCVARLREAMEGPQ